MHTFLFISLFLSLYSPDEIIPISKAIESQQITCVFYSNPDSSIFSSHYGECLQVRITAGEEPVNISYDVGQLLAPQDDETQQLILTKSGIIALKANEQKIVNLYAMCGEKYDFGPTRGDTFRLNGLASADITGLADLIGEKDHQNSLGQSAIWVLTDDEPIYTITGDDVDEVNELRKYIAKVKGIEQQPYKPNIAYQQLEMRRLEVKFEARIRKKGKGSITLYNPDGSLNEVLIKDQLFYPGIHRLKFFAESIELQEGMYKVVLTIDGVQRQEEYYEVE